MPSDLLDKVIQQWKAALPDFDARPLGVVGRILRLAGHLEQRANERLKPFDLPIWAFDVLGTLRRQGPPYSLTPSELLRSMMLTSGAMTNRIDRLESRGLVVRKPDPNDRRSLRVALTPQGLELVDQAAATRFDEARSAIEVLSAAERKQLASLLKKILLDLEA